MTATTAPTFDTRRALRVVGAYADQILAALVLAYVIVQSARRLRYGVDFSDESFFAAITQRFALGDRPYVDEFNLRQTAGLIPVPLYWAYLKITGSTDGTILFLRQVFLGVQLFVGWSVYRFVTPRLPRAFGLVAAAFVIAFSPFCVSTCSYNNLGCMFFTGGLFVGLRGILDDTSERTLTLAGVLHGLACVAYPPLVVPVTFFGLTTRFLPEARTSEKPWRFFSAFVFGLLLIGVPAALWVGPGFLGSGFKNAMNYEGMTTRARTLDKVKGIFAAVNKLSPAAPSSVTTLVVAAVVAKLFPRARPWVFAVVLLVLANWFSEMQPEAGNQYPVFTLSLHLSIYLGIAASLFLVSMPWGTLNRTLVWSVWLPSMLAGLIMATASDNTGCMNGGLGTFAAAVLAVVAAPLALEPEKKALGPVERLLAVAVLATLPLSSLFVSLSTSYSDGPLSEHMPVVRSGPFRGLHAPAAKVAQAEELNRELRALVKPGERMLSYYNFPAGYLSVAARPAVQTVWTDHRAKLGVLLPYYQRHRTGQGIALVITGRAGTSYEVESLVESPDRLLVDKGWFRIYREPPP